MRVSRAVPVLVMMKNWQNAILQIRKALDQFGPEPRMRFHDSEFIRAKLPRLTQNRTEHLVNLPDVMQKCRDVDPFHFLSCKPEHLSYHASVSSNSTRMPRRVRITSFDSSDHQIQQLPICSL